MTLTHTPDGTDEGRPAPSGSEGTEGCEATIRTRLLLPLLIPAVTVFAVATVSLDISRLFLAGDRDGALVAAVVVTFAILLGATTLAAFPRIRTSSLALVLGSTLLVISGIGLVTLGPSVDHGHADRRTGYVEPSGASAATVKVIAGPGLTFDGTAFDARYEAPNGIVRIDYGGAAGHTLAIDGPRFAGFLLSSTGSPRSAKVALAPGNYTIYCTVPGHRAAGMQGTIHMT